MKYDLAKLMKKNLELNRQIFKFSDDNEPEDEEDAEIEDSAAKEQGSIVSGIITMLDSGGEDMAPIAFETLLSLKEKDNFYDEPTLNTKLLKNLVEAIHLKAHELWGGVIEVKNKKMPKERFMEEFKDKWYDMDRERSLEEREAFRSYYKYTYKTIPAFLNLKESGPWASINRWNTGYTAEMKIKNILWGGLDIGNASAGPYYKPTQSREAKLRLYNIMAERVFESYE